MSAEHTYDYAIVRVVPRVERGERVNVGAIVSCPALDYLEACIEPDEARLLAIDPEIDLEALRKALATIPAICRGDASTGELAALPQRARFHWLVAPRSTVVQVSAVHSGRTADPARTLDHLMNTMVRRPGPVQPPS